MPPPWLHFRIFLLYLLDAVAPCPSLFSRRMAGAERLPEEVKRTLPLFWFVAFMAFGVLARHKKKFLNIVVQNLL